MTVQSSTHSAKGIPKRDLRRSNAQFQRAATRLPLGVSSNFRYWGENQTIYVARGKGGRITDLDGYEYIDYRLAYGPIILGYADERVDAAAAAAIPVGGVFALATEAEYQVASRINRMVPGAELVRFSNSGTEAVMAALRIARAVTEKDSYVVIEGGYHGVFDAALWYSDVETWDPRQQKDPELEPYGDGVPRILKRLIHSVPLNDAQRLEDTLKRHRDDIGAVLIEPIMGNCCGISASAEYLSDVRRLCNEFGVLLIVDEVKTGFRVARGGVQELLGVQADLCTFAKAIANGYPLAVVAGKAEYMRAIETGVVHGGTFTGHAVALAAADKTLEILDETSALGDIERYGRRLREGLSAILTQRGVAHCFSGHPAMSGLFFRETPPDNYRDWVETNYEFYDTLAPQLHELGVLVEPDSREPWFMCQAHAENGCLEQTLERFERAVDAVLAKTNRAT